MKQFKSLQKSNKKNLLPLSTLEKHSTDICYQNIVILQREWKIFFFKKRFLEGINNVI